MKRLPLVLLACMALALPAALRAAGPEYRFRVSFADKRHSPYSLRHPERYLSPAALARRHKWGLKVDRNDLPVSPAYLDKVRQAGLSVLCVSRWNNTALVAAPADSAAAHAALEALPCVSRVEAFGLYRPHVFTDSVDAARLQHLSDSVPAATAATGRAAYGAGITAIAQLDGLGLHSAGYRGAGMTVAVLDGGFLNADAVDMLRNVRVMGTHNFVRPDHSVYAEGEHGTNVLSCMAARRPGVMVGTAPEARYWLMVTEDTYTEMPYEQDFWVAGIEMADSVGADVVTSSLSYTRMDRAAYHQHYWQQDGRTAFISRAASLGAGRGLMVLNSAGNDGNDAWKRIGFPGDARDMLTVGAVDSHGVNAKFSSVGPTSDGRVKPDVMALGVKAAIVNSAGDVTTANGTSFACPIMAGMTTCLMQALPRLRPTQIIDLIHRSGRNAAHPDNIFGYGIPNFDHALSEGHNSKH